MQANLSSLLVACSAIVWLTACSQNPVPEKSVVRPVRAIEVADPSQFSQRVFPGQAKATQELELSFRVAGPLITRPVLVRDQVTEGDLRRELRIRPRQASNHTHSRHEQHRDGDQHSREPDL